MLQQLPAGVRAPLQDRSRKTFADILEATEALMNERSWVDITVGDIVTAANCTVGSFYARFDDKDAVLACLSEQLSEEVEAASARNAELAAASSPEQLITELVDQLAAVYRRRVGLIRTLTLLPRLHQDDSLREDGLRTAQVFRNLVELLVGLGAERERAEIGLFFVVNAIRERILFPEISTHLIKLDSDQLGRGLIRAFVSYVAGNGSRGPG